MRVRARAIENDYQHGGNVVIAIDATNPIIYSYSTTLASSYHLKKLTKSIKRFFRFCILSPNAAKRICKLYVVSASCIFAMNNKYCAGSTDCVCLHEI